MLLNSDIPCLYIVGGVISERSSFRYGSGRKLRSHDSSRTCVGVGSMRNRDELGGL